MSQLVGWLLALPPSLVLLAAALFPAVEASALVGLVVPGETAVFVAGLTAHGGHLPLWAVVVAASAGAVVGDQVGFRLGRRLGPRLLDRLRGHARRRRAVDRAVALVALRGGLAVLAGRWTALMRALMPGLAGASGMSTRTFTTFNLLGGITWATAVAALGYLAGSAYQRVLASLNQAGQIGLAAAGAAVLLAVLTIRIRRRLRGGRSHPPQEVDELEPAS